MGGLDGWVAAAIKLFLIGIQDALNFYWSCLYIVKSEKIRKATLRCVLLNGLLLVGSVALLHTAVLPFIHIVGGLVLTADDGELTKGVVQHIVAGAVNILYQIFWIVPLYMISLLMNTIWFSRIGDAAFELRHGVKASVGVQDTIKEALYRGLVVVIYMMLTLIVYKIPVVGELMSLVMVCWINAMYSFEGAWAMQGMDLQTRLDFMESYWPYFMGFGMPVALVSSFWSLFVGLGVFAVCFPACIIQATCSSFCKPLDKRLKSSHGRLWGPRFPIFRFSAMCANVILRSVNDAVTKRR